MIFISHPSANRAEARQLALELSRVGRKVWVDELSIDPGDDLHDSLREAIDGCSVFVLLASMDALSSPWVSLEIEHARGRDKQPRFISVLLEDILSDNLPANFRALVYLPSNLGLAATARKIIRAESQCEAHVDDGIPVWIRLAQNHLVQPLESMTTRFPEIAQVHVLNTDWQNVLHEILRSARPDLAWLDRGEASNPWLDWVYNMPARAETAVDSLRTVLNVCMQKLSGASALESQFVVGFGVGWMQTVVRRLQEALLILRHFGDPLAGYAEDGAIRHKSWEPFPDGLLVDLAWTSPTGGRTKSRAPTFVEAIDLPLGMHNALSILPPHELGLMTGSSTAAKAWVTWSDPSPAKTLEMKIPVLQSLQIGPA